MVEDYLYKISYDYWYACFPYEKRQEYISLEYDAETEEGMERLIEELTEKEHAMKDWPLKIIDLERIE